MKKLLFTIIILVTLLGFHKAEAAIARDNCTGFNEVTATSLTFSYIVTSTTTNPILFVSAKTAGLKTVTGVTYGGTAMTQINTVTIDGNYRSYLFYLNAPATGANNVVITANESNSIGGMAASYTGVNQSVIYTGGSKTDNASTTSSNTSPLANAVTTIADNSWTIVNGWVPSGGCAASTGSTLYSPTANPWCIFDNKGNGAITPAGSYSMSFTGSGTGLISNMASFSPFVAATPPVIPPQNIIIFE